MRGCRAGADGSSRRVRRPSATRRARAREAPPPSPRMPTRRVVVAARHYGAMVGIECGRRWGAFRVPERAELLKGDELAAMIHQLEPGTPSTTASGSPPTYGTLSSASRRQDRRAVRGLHDPQRPLGLQPFRRQVEVTRGWSSATLPTSSAGRQLTCSTWPDRPGRDSRGASASSRRSARGPRPTPRRSTGRAHAFGEELGAEDPVKKGPGRQAALGGPDDWRCTTQPANSTSPCQMSGGARFRAAGLREQGHPGLSAR